MAQGYSRIVAPTRTELDLENRDAVISYFKQERAATVFHLAARVFGLKGNIENQRSSFGSNVSINCNVVDACVEAGVQRIIAAGTVAAYGFPFVRLPLQEEDFWIGEPHGGEYGYSVAKRLMLSHLNLLAMAGCSYSFSYCALTNLYGPKDNFKDDLGHVVPGLVRKGIQAKRTGSVLEVWGDGTQVRDFLYVQDAARALILVGRSAYRGLINVCSGQPKSLMDLVSHIKEAIGSDIRIRWRHDMPVGIRERSVNGQRLRDLGFCQITSLGDGINKTVRWVESTGLL